MIKKFKKFFFDWIIYIPLGLIIVFYVNSIDELFLQIQNSFLQISSIILLIYSFLNIFLDGNTVFSIEENIWADFKRGLDNDIDRMVDSIIFRAKILIFLMIVWTIIFFYFIIENYDKIDLYKFLFVFLVPLIINGLMIKNTYQIKKDYDS